MVAIHWDRKGGSELRFGERLNDIRVGKLGASVLEFRLDLGLGQGQNTRLSILVLGQPPNRQHPHSSSGKLLRIFPSLCSISHLVLHPPTTRKDSSPLCPDRTRYAPCRAQGARQEPRGQLHCLDGFLAKERGNPMDRGAWWARVRGVAKSWARLSRWARAPGGSTTPTDPKHTWVPAKATRRRPEGRGQPAPRRAEDESLDRPTSTGPDWPAPEKDLNKPPSRLPLQILSLQWHWWFSGRILASHAGDPGSIPGQCIVVVFLLVLAGSIQETWAGRFPWRRKWQPTPVFLPGVIGPRDGKKSKRTERLPHI